MSTPIMMGDALVGVVTLYALRSEAFTRRQVEIIEGVASHLAPILRRRKSVGHSARPLLDGQLAAPHLDQYLRQFLERKAPKPLHLLVLRVGDHSCWRLSQVVGEVYENLRGGDLVFVCDEHTLVCLIANGDRMSATSAGERSYGRHATALVPGYEQLYCVCRRTVRHWHRCSTAPNLILTGRSTRAVS